MTFAQIDDHFDDHPKYIGYGAAEMGVLACAITFSNRHLTDGVIPKAWVVQRFGKDGARAMKSFLEDGIWTERDAKHCTIVGFLEHNPSRDEVLERRARMSEQKSEAGRVGGVRSGEARRSKREAESKQVLPVRLPSAANQTKQNEALSSPSPLRSEKEIPPTPQGGQDETPVSQPSESPREQDYQAAYESGVSEALGREWAMPRNQRGELHQALVTFAKDPRTGEKLRGERILRWLRFQGKELVRVVNESGEDPKFWSSFGPRGMLRMLNEVPVAESRRPELESGVIKLPAGLYDPRKVSGE